jgi:hypothetical protein
MRYFLSLTRTEPALTGGVGQATPARRTVTGSGASQRRRSGPFSATAGAVEVPPVALSTDKDLAMAAGTMVQTGTGFHRHNRADEGWIKTTPSATLAWLCESTVGA